MSLAYCGSLTDLKYKELLSLWVIKAFALVSIGASHRKPSCASAKRNAANAPPRSYI